MRFTAMNRGRHGKLAMATAALGISLLSVTGCGYINPQQTTAQYTSSDGTSADLGPLELRNIMIISSGENEPGRLLGAVYNSSSKDVVLTVKGAAGSQARVSVEKNSVVNLSEPQDKTLLDSTGGRPGSLVEVMISEDGTSQSTQFKVPVLDGTIADYKPYLPTTGGAGSEDTGSPTPTPSSTPDH